MDGVDDRHGRGSLRSSTLVAGVVLTLWPIGCAHLSPTDLSAGPDGKARLGRLIGRNRVEPGLQLPDGPVRPDGWTDLARREPSRSGEIALAADAESPPAVRTSRVPAGAVPALHGPTRPQPRHPAPEARASTDAASEAPTPIKPAHTADLPSDPAPAPISGMVSSTPASSPPEQQPLAQIDQLIEQGDRQLASTRSYRVTMTRQERVDGRLLPRETVILCVRRNPLGVRLEWPVGAPNGGREVLYSDQECNGLMHVKMGASPIPLPTMKLAPDSPLAMKNSRHPIQEAGLEPILAETRRKIEAIRAGDPTVGTMIYEGTETPQGSSVACHRISRTTPDGETWVLWLDVQTCLPVAVDGRDAAGEILEFYQFDNPQFDLTELAQADAFDPAKRFGAGGGGFLGRLAQAAQQGAAAADTPAANP